MKKVIVTGATGQDGSYMVEYLLRNTDNTVICAIRRTSQAILSNLKDVLDNPRVKLVTIDLNDVHSITSLIRDEKPDYFINFGASAFVPDSWNSPAQVMQTNAIALIHILEAVRQFVPHCHVYNAGSSEEYGNVLYSPQDEKHPARPRSVYGVSKAAARMIAKVYRESYGLYVVQGLLFNHESERRQEHYVTRKITKAVARIAKAIKDGKPFEPLELGNLDAKRDWSHAEDFIRGVWLLLNQETVMHHSPDWDVNPKAHQLIHVCREGDLPLMPKEYILSSNETHTVREFVEKAFAEAAIKGWWMESTGNTPTNETFVMGLYEAIRNWPPEAKNMIVGDTHCLVRINPAFYRPAEVNELHGDSSAVRRELGWEPKVSFDELVRRMVRHDMAALGM